MDNEKVIKLTLAAQIAGHALHNINPDADSAVIAKKVVDMTMDIIEQLYERIN